MPEFTLSKEERLTRKKIIEEVFASGKSVKSPAVVLVYLFTPLPVELPVQVLFTASKRNFKRAHDRNRIKRLLREAYRHQKHPTLDGLKASGRQAALLFIFTGKQLPDYAYVHGRMRDLLKRFALETQNVPKDIESHEK